MEQAILDILIKHSVTPTVALLAAMRDVYKAGAASATPTASTQGGDDGDDDAPDSPLTASDRAALLRLGINPDKKFTSGRTTYTVTGYKPSRWKYPVSCVNQNGRRFKFRAESVVSLQRSS